MSEIQIKLIDKDTDISSLEMKKYDWDLVVCGVPYQLVEIPGYVHSIEYSFGRESANCMWAYPLNEEPTYENLSEYTIKEPVCWGIVYNPYHDLSYSWEDSEICRCNECYVTRNGERFSDSVHSIQAAQMLINQFQNHPIDFGSRNYENEILGRKVWWRSEPGIITSFIKDQACVIIEPDGIEKFSTPAEFKNDDIIHDEDDIKADVFDSHIWWFRE